MDKGGLGVLCGPGTESVQWDILEVFPTYLASGLDLSSQNLHVCFLVCPKCWRRGQEQGFFSDPGSLLPWAGGGGGEVQAAPLDCWSRRSWDTDS